MSEKHKNIGSDGPTMDCRTVKAESMLCPNCGKMHYLRTVDYNGSYTTIEMIDEQAYFDINIEQGIAKQN